MRILLVTTGLLTGGAEVQVAALAGGFSRQGHAVAILNMTGHTQLPLDPRVTILPLDMHGTTSVIRGVAKARQMIRSWRPDVVHSHMLKANIFTRLLRLVCPLPALICTAHSLHEGGPAWMRLYAWTDRMCELTTHVSQEAVDHFIDVGAAPATRIRLMPNGVDLKRFSMEAPVRESVRRDLSLAPEQLAWLHVGRLVPVKAQHRLLAAFAQVYARQAQARLFIVGSGPLEQTLRTQAGRLGLDSVVRFLGHRTDVPALMRAADGFVLSSDLEGSPMVLAEAGASGLPIVSTDVAGAAALLGRYGRRVPVGDASALAQALLASMAEQAALAPAPAQALRDARRAHVAQNFDLDSVCARWLDLYDSLLRQPHARLMRR